MVKQLANGDPRLSFITQRLSPRNEVKGRVIKITEQAVIIDVGYKSEGIVPLAEFKEGDQIVVQPGDEIDVFVKQLENNEGYVELSRADAIRMQTWDQIEKASRDAVVLKGRVTDRIKGGLRVDIGGIQAFLPGSQVDVRPVRNLDSYRNKEIEVRVLKVNKKRGNIVLSRKVVLEEQVSTLRNQTFKDMEEGIIKEGQVKKGDVKEEIVDKETKKIMRERAELIKLEGLKKKIEAAMAVA